MAEPIQARIDPAPIEPSPGDELQRLLGSLHKHGFLRLANDMVAAQAGIAEVLLRGLNEEGTRNAMQNLSVLAMALSQVPPEQFYKLVFALKDAAHRLAEEAESGESRPAAPGVRGTWHMLNDEGFWSAIGPLLRALETFGACMRKLPVEPPISEFSGKPGGS